VGVVDGLEDLDPRYPGGDLDGAVGAVVRGQDHPVGREGLVQAGLQGGPNGLFFVVGGDEHRDSQSLGRGDLGSFLRR
jgi:hypothetical protein